MKKLKTIGVWTALALAACALALAGCSDPVSPTPQEGGAIVTPWEPGINGNPGSTNFTISNGAEVAAPNTGEQRAEYAVGTSVNGPTTAWQDGFTFTNLEPDSDYWVYARAKENGNYAAGAWIRGEGDDVTPVTTRKAGQDASVLPDWAPIPANATTEIYDLEADPQIFSIVAAEPTAAFSGRAVQYLLAQTRDPEEAAASLQWQSGRRMRFDRITDPTQQYRLWARVAAVGTEPAGFPLSVDLKLPGLTLTQTGLSATGSASGTGATVTILGGPGRSPDIPATAALSVRYGLGPASGPVDSLGWHVPAEGTGIITFSGLSQNTQYYLYAKTWDGETTPNFRQGTPLKYNSPGQDYLFATGGTLGSAAELQAKLNSIKDGSAVISSTSTNTVRLVDKVELNDNLNIPNGVTLLIVGGSNPSPSGELVANNKRVDGSEGIIEVDGGTLTVTPGMVGVKAIVVYPDSTYNIASTGVSEEKALIDSASAPIKLENSATITIQYTGLMAKYTLDSYNPTSSQTPKATISADFSMAQGESFTVKSGTELAINNGSGAVSGGGLLEVLAGGKLTAAKISVFDGLDANGSLVIKGGATATITNASNGMGLKVGPTNSTTSPSEDILLPSSMQITLKTTTTGSTHSNTFALSGSGTAIANSLTVGKGTSGTNNVNFIVETSATLSIPAASTAKELKVSDGGTLTVNGTLNVEDKGTTTGNNAARLTIDGATSKGGTLAVGGTLNVRDGATLDIGKNGTTPPSTTPTDAKANVSGTINVYSDSVNVGGTMTMDNGAININAGGHLQFNTGAVVRGTSSAKINVSASGRLDTDTDFTSFYTATPTPTAFGGSVEIKGDLLWVGSSGDAYIGTTVSTATPGTLYPKNGFLLSSGAYITVKFAAAGANDPAIIPYYTLSGTASVEGPEAASPPPDGTLLKGNFTGGTLNIANGKVLYLNDAKTVVSNTSFTPASGGGKIKGKTNARLIGTVPSGMIEDSDADKNGNTYTFK